MFLTRSEYDRGVNTFSPEGRLFQVEYAIEAIKIGTTAVGICTSEGVVLAVEKRLLSPLQEPGSVEKIYEVDSHIGCAMSGLSADARTLVDHARSESQYHRFTFNEPMPVESLTQAVCDLALNFGEGDDESEATMARPFGVALLVAGWDHRGPVLYHTDSSGTFTRFDAKAIGAGSEGAQTALQEQFHKNLTLLEAETMAITILKQVRARKLLPHSAMPPPLRTPCRLSPHRHHTHSPPLLPSPKNTGHGGEAGRDQRRGRQLSHAPGQAGQGGGGRVPLCAGNGIQPAVRDVHDGGARGGLGESRGGGGVIERGARLYTDRV